jgi:hypothetical protein
MRHAAETGRSEYQLAGLRLGHADKLRQRVDRHLLIDNEDFRHRYDLGDEGQILEWMEGHILAQVHIHRQPARRRNGERVTVGFGLGHRGNPGETAGACPVLDHHALSDQACHFVGQDATDGIGGSPCRERHDELDGPIGVVLGVRVQGPRQHSNQAGKAHP